MDPHNIEDQMIRILTTLFLILSTILFYALIIQPKQDGKNKAKQKAAEEAESRRKAEQAFKIRSALLNNEPGRGYENNFIDTELMAERM